MAQDQLLTKAENYQLVIPDTWEGALSLIIAMMMVDLKNPPADKAATAQIWKHQLGRAGVAKEWLLPTMESFLDDGDEKWFPTTGKFIARAELLQHQADRAGLLDATTAFYKRSEAERAQRLAERFPDTEWRDIRKTLAAAMTDLDMKFASAPKLAKEENKGIVSRDAAAQINRWADEERARRNQG